jgi:SpoVK/Ycf46/Vps4 family AAA+-type ATPase
MYQTVLEAAPDKIKTIIQREKLYPNGYKHRVNRLLFIGVPGVGKSLLAKAVACQMGQSFFIRHSDVMKKYRNETSNRLNKALKEIIKYSGKNILIIDEINKLTDNHKSENSDSGITAATLWTFLDEQQSNPNFFFIGTTNHPKKLPEELQSRFHSAVATISVPSTNTRRSVIRHLMMESELQCVPNTAESLDRLSSLTENYSVRDLIQLMCDIENFAYQLHKDKPYIDQECLEHALRVRQDEDRNIWDTNPISDEERRHQESLQQVRELEERANGRHRENIQISRDSLQQARDLHRRSEEQMRELHNESATISMLPFQEIVKHANAIAYLGAKLVGHDTGPAHSFLMRKFGVNKQ